MGRTWGAGSFCLPRRVLRLPRARRNSSLRPTRSIRCRRRTTAELHALDLHRWQRARARAVPLSQVARGIDRLLERRFADRPHQPDQRLERRPGGEFTDKLETVERYRRVGDRIEGEITLYDPEVFVRPRFARRWISTLSRKRARVLRPFYNTCTDTNGPASRVYMNNRGFLDSAAPGDPGFWDETDPRPWGTYYTESDRRFRPPAACRGSTTREPPKSPRKRATRTTAATA